VEIGPVKGGSCERPSFRHVRIKTAPQSAGETYLLSGWVSVPRLEHALSCERRMLQTFSGATVEKIRLAPG
jgi:hypothetical protein